MKRIFSFCRGPLIAVEVALAASAIAVLAVLETLNAFGRKFLMPVPCCLEAAESLMIVMVFLGIAYVAREEEHTQITITTRMLPPYGQRLLDAIAYAFGSLVFAILTYGAWPVAIAKTLQLEIRIGVFHFPVWIFRLFFAIGLTLMTVQCVVNAITFFQQALALKRGTDEAAGPPEGTSPRQGAPGEHHGSERRGHMKKGVRCLIVCTILLSWAAFGAWGVDAPAAAKEYQKVLKLASPMPEKSFAGFVHKWWAQELEKRTKGRVKTQFFWMESLVKWTDMLQGVASGIADVGYVAATYHPSDLPLYMVVDMPGNAKDYWAGARAVTDACHNQPDLVAELEKKNIVHVGPWISGAFHLATKGTWNSLGELKGKTFRAFGGAFIDYFSLLGINPIFMSYSEIYEAMNRGTIWGNQAVLQLSDALKHYEVTKQVTNAGMGFVVGGSGLALNRKVWLGMPKDIHAIMKQLDYDLGQFWAEELYKAEEKIKKSWRAKGVVVNEFSPADAKLSREVTAKAQEKFLNKLESQGLPAKKVWSYFRGRVNKYEKEVKEKGHPWERK